MKPAVHQAVATLLAVCITALSGAMVYEDLIPRGRWEHACKVVLGVLALLALRFPWPEAKAQQRRSLQTPFPDEEKKP